MGEGGIRAFASMTDEVFAFSSSNLPCGIPCPDTSSTASGPPSSYNAKRCMKSFHRNAWHHGSAVYIINAKRCMASPKVYGITPSACIKTLRSRISSNPVGFHPSFTRISPERSEDFTSLTPHPPQAVPLLPLEKAF